MAEKLYLVVGTRYSSIDSSSNQKPAGLSQASVEFLGHLRALDMWDQNGLTPSGDAFVDSQPYNDELWAKVGELYQHFGLDLNG